MNNYNNDKETYIKVLNTALIPLLNFDCIEYKVAPNTGGEFIRQYDTLGNCTYLDITGFDLERILLDVFAVAIGNKPQCVITDPVKCRMVNRLFKED